MTKKITNLFFYLWLDWNYTTGVFMSRYDYNYHYQLESYRSFYTRANQNNLTCDLELIGLNY